LEQNKSPRLQKFLAERGVGSRRAIEEWISQGRILCNGEKASLGQRLAEKDEILVLDGRGFELYRATMRGVYDERAKTWLEPGFEYWIVNKPRGVITSTRDPHHSRMVTHLVHSKQRLFPVGRLDKESEGLVLLTSDGELCHRLIHPRFGVRKRYEVTLDWQPQRQILEEIARGGVPLEDGPTLECAVRVISPRRLEITMREGRKREIRRVFEHFGHKVIRLRRVALGPLELGNLAIGNARRLEQDEVELLKVSVSFVHQRVENRVHERVNRRPGALKPGQSWGRESKRSSARKDTRKGSSS